MPAVVPVKVLTPNKQGSCFWGRSNSQDAAKTLSVNVNNGMKVADVKSQIQEKGGVPMKSQSLFLFGCELENERTLETYGINSEGQAAGVAVAFHMVPSK
mmetsp:Transcript_9749/g.17585  ORF Transcript_9749/g.17585 Transcript_9749/m.17585 type:complete len:100 (+) Transcript_9749:76-375(+)